MEELVKNALMAPAAAAKNAQRTYATAQTLGQELLTFLRTGPGAKLPPVTGMTFDGIGLRCGIGLRWGLPPPNSFELTFAQNAPRVFFAKDPYPEDRLYFVLCSLSTAHDVDQLLEEMRRLADSPAEGASSAHNFNSQQATNAYNRQHATNGSTNCNQQ